MDHILKYFSKLSSLLTTPLLSRFSDEQKREETEQKWLAQDEKNVLKDVIFKIFKNVNQITLYSTDDSGSKEYIMNLQTILIMLSRWRSKTTSRVKMKIIATHRYEIKGKKPIVLGVAFGEKIFGKEIWGTERKK